MGETWADISRTAFPPAPNVIESSGCLTREMFRTFTDQCIADLGKTPKPLVIYSHPLDAPFVEAIYGDGCRVDLDTVLIGVDWGFDRPTIVLYRAAEFWRGDQFLFWRVTKFGKLIGWLRLPASLFPASWLGRWTKA
jgi:hypothetical protein